MEQRDESFSIRTTCLIRDIGHILNTASVHKNERKYIPNKSVGLRFFVMLQ